MNEPSVPQKSEAERLEALWAGDFGDAYVERNRAAGEKRRPFWRQILDEFPAKSALEIGCNLGANLRWLAAMLPTGDVFGVDVNAAALRELRRNLPDANAVRAAGRELPFRDRWFDLTFTAGVLIHQPDATLPLVMSEIVRCSRRFVLCAEYHSDDSVEVPYRGHSGALFKRNYGDLYQQLFPELKLRKQGFLGKDQGWDDVTFWMFERYDRKACSNAPPPPG
jgi:pseudaminic acid biosynthesis-associated methylase